MEKDKNNKDQKQLFDKNDNIPDINIRKEDVTKKTHSIRNDTNTNIFLLMCIVGVSLAILLEIINVQNKKQNVLKDYTHERKYYWVYSAHSDVHNRNGLLKHVHLVLERMGYELSTNATPWTLLWSHDYPFRALYPRLHKLQGHQMVNHFPGTGFITNKVDLATSDSKFIPKAFKIPEHKEEFLKYAAENKHAMFLQKHNQHRGVYLKNVTAIDLSSGESFVQEYVQDPFLVDGHRFDVGVYVAVTSVDPLRAYWYGGDVLFRYCPEKYYPFDPKNLNKYVVGDDYRPTWEVPALARVYSDLGFGMKDAFDHYATSKGGNTTRMWEEVQEAITEVLLSKEHHIIEALKSYPSRDNFFELMRFDLVVDAALHVRLLEANMSPNLSAAHFAPNRLLYEQVLYNLFTLTGLAAPRRARLDASDEAPRSMVSAQKNIVVYRAECAGACECGARAECALCGRAPCAGARLRGALLAAHAEHLRRGDFRRLFPPSTKPNEKSEEKLKNLNHKNKLLYLWYQGKCNNDITWCA